MILVTYRLVYWTMLSKDFRLKLSEICCKVRLGRKVSLEDRIWVTKLCEEDKQAASIRDRLIRDYQK
tara:strand:+ start:553 stop:753 length:201 start_codon:yes stop_codon:yes gene_type:complete